MPREKGCNGCAVEMQEEEHTREEQGHLPHRDKGVHKVPGLLQTVL